MQIVIDSIWLAIAIICWLVVVAVAYEFGRVALVDFSNWRYRRKERRQFASYEEH